jgi:hypothetical protein
METCEELSSTEPGTSASGTEPTDAVISTVAACGCGSDLSRLG